MRLNAAFKFGFLVESAVILVLGTRSSPWRLEQMPSQPSLRQAKIGAWHFIHHVYFIASYISSFGFFLLQRSQ